CRRRRRHLLSGRLLSSHLLGDCCVDLGLLFVLDLLVLIRLGVGLLLVFCLRVTVHATNDCCCGTGHHGRPRHRADQTWPTRPSDSSAPHDVASSALANAAATISLGIRSPATIWPPAPAMALARSVAHTSS